MPVFKLLLPAEWAAFEAAGRFDGSPLDRRDGFVHCSTAAQVAATARRFFADAPALVVVELDPARLGDVRYEGSAHGGPFPHVYGPLPVGAVLRVHHVPGPEGVADVPGVQA